MNPTELDGVGLAQWSANHHPDVIVVLTSGMQHALNTAQAACPLVKAFVLKPYDIDAVVQRLRGLVTARAKKG